MEFSQLGWNMLTLGFAGTLIMTGITAWSMHRQSLVITRMESGESLSFLQFIYGTGASAATLIYGISILKFVLIVNGIVIICARWPLLKGLLRYKGLSLADKTTIAFLGLALIGMILSPTKGGFYVMFLLGGMVFTAAQPWEIAKNKSRGVVDHRMLLASFTGSCFWLAYGIGIENKIIVIASAMGLVTHVTSLCLWLYYRPLDD